MKNLVDLIGMPTYELIENNLRDEIISGALPPGTRITIQEIAKRYNVSEMPVREALQRLQGEGLIELLPHKGSRVKVIDPSFMENIYDIRGAIEGLLICSSVENISLSAIAAAETINQKLSEAVAANRLADVVLLNMEFHETIYQFNTNPEAYKIHKKYSSLLKSLRTQYPVSPERMKKMADEHTAIIAAIKAQNKALLERLVREHSEGGKRDLLLQMK
jgi:DNA-binding GntR family transcriptional regulator